MNLTTIARSGRADTLAHQAVPLSCVATARTCAGRHRDGLSCVSAAWIFSREIPLPPAHGARRAQREAMLSSIGGAALVARPRQQRKTARAQACPAQNASQEPLLLRVARGEGECSMNRRMLSGLPGLPVGACSCRPGPSTLLSTVATATQWASVPRSGSCAKLAAT